MKRVIIVVLDSVGIGEMPDADRYGDVGSNTIGNISAAVEGFRLPNLQRLGLGNIDGIKGISRADNPEGSFGRMAEASFANDTTTGHWEIAGIISDKPFPTYPNGFPDEIVKAFEKQIDRGILGNCTASGTEIIKQLGEQHMKTGDPIVYTSADSVLQIAAHEDIIPIEQLYDMCRIARRIMKGKHAVARVIARPFEGKPGHFVRTDRRHDFSLNPPSMTVLDYTLKNGYKVKAVGKIEDIFNGKGISEAVHIHNNMDGVDKTLDYMRIESDGIIFTNLVDFDMLYGHRNDTVGYAKALMDFDARIPEILTDLKQEDVLIITADHGCDPTTESTNHSREYVPLIVYGSNIKPGVNLGTRSTFADIGSSIAEYLGIKAEIAGKSFI